MKSEREWDVPGLGEARLWYQIWCISRGSVE